jgi:hypothetical protein
MVICVERVWQPDKNRRTLVFIGRKLGLTELPATISARNAVIESHDVKIIDSCNSEPSFISSGGFDNTIPGYII